MPRTSKVLTPDQAERVEELLQKAREYLQKAASPFAASVAPETYAAVASQIGELLEELADDADSTT